MKSIKNASLMIGMGLLLSLAACNSNKGNEGTSATTDSTTMDNTESQMSTDTMSVDSTTRNP